MDTTTNKVHEFFSYLLNDSGIRAMSQINKQGRSLMSSWEILSIRYSPTEDGAYIHISREMFDAVLNQTIEEIRESPELRSTFTASETLEILKTKHKLERSAGSGRSVHASICIKLDGVPVKLAACTDIEAGEIWPVIPKAVSPDIQDGDVLQYAYDHGFNLKRVPLLGPEEGPTELDGWALMVPSPRGGEPFWGAPAGYAKKYFESLQDAYRCMVSIVSERGSEE